MKSTIFARNAQGTSIQGPDCVKHPACLSMLLPFLDFGESAADCDSHGNSQSVRFTAQHIRDALKQVIVAMKANRRRHSQLLEEEYELIRPPMPAHVLAAQEAMGPPRRFFMPWVSGGTDGVASSPHQEDGVPPGMIELREIRMTRTFGNPDPEVLKTLLEEIQRKHSEYHALWELLGFFRRCRTSAPVTIGKL